MYYAAELFLELFIENSKSYLNVKKIVEKLEEKAKTTEKYSMALRHNYIDTSGFSAYHSLFKICDFLVEKGFLLKNGNKNFFEEWGWCSYPTRTINYEIEYKLKVSVSNAKKFITGIPDHEKVLNYLISCEYEYFREDMIESMFSKEEVDFVRAFTALCLNSKSFDGPSLIYYIADGRKYLNYFCLNDKRHKSTFVGNKIKPEIVLDAEDGWDYLEEDSDDEKIYLYGPDYDDDEDDSDLVIRTGKYKVSNDQDNIQYEVRDEIMSPGNCDIYDDNYDDIEDFSDDYNDDYESGYDDYDDDYDDYDDDY